MYKLISRKNASKKSKSIEWNDKCDEAFRKLKEICTSASISAYVDLLKPFTLHPDAFTLGLGAILYQSQDGAGCAIGYASQSLSKTEHKYLAHKLEFLALKWAIMERFYKYLQGNHFAMYTDNNPLTYVLTKAKLDATGHWWVAGLVNYNFTLNYHSGEVNVDAEALSHIPKAEYDQSIEAESIYALFSQTVKGTTLIEAYSCNIYVTETLDRTEDLKAMSEKDWVIVPNRNPAIREIKYLMDKKLIGMKIFLWVTPSVKHYLRQHSHLVL